ncbi:MAG TPA: ABC transporter ATP-binding protein [Stellaceae bacterium]|nr:ABC transporter ATP-binding protein [Stellaceae bacterium]
MCSDIGADVVIRAERLGKKYRIGDGTKRGQYGTFRDAMARGAGALYRGAANAVRCRLGSRAPRAEEFWALRDVAFEVKRGEVLAVVGRNGAGKSTLMKILSRVTHPSEGRVAIAGRVASLLEVGTGFHPELTGRENIYLNGAILGMRRREIRRKFDEIVAFAEVERFLDTPVKRYSSGMYVRLAFAVAAHLEADILIVDEVLAVGDAEFQRKCLGRMSDIAGAGRTVLFVSHNVGAVARLCSSAMLLEGGRILRRGTPMSVIGDYLGGARSGAPLDVRSPNYPFVLRSVEVLDNQGRHRSVLASHRPFRVRITYELLAPMRRLRIGFRLHAEDGTVVLTSTDCDSCGSQVSNAVAGRHAAEAEVPANLLNRGRYYLSVGVDVPMVSVVLTADRAAEFTVEAVSGMLADINDARLGVVAPLLVWSSGPDRT